MRKKLWKNFEAYFLDLIKYQTMFECCNALDNNFKDTIKITDNKTWGKYEMSKLKINLGDGFIKYLFHSI